MTNVSSNKAGVRAVLAGDYNVVPSELDIYEPHSYDAASRVRGYEGASDHAPVWIKLQRQDRRG